MPVLASFDSMELFFFLLIFFNVEVSLFIADNTSTAEWGIRDES